MVQVLNETSSSLPLYLLLIAAKGRVSLHSPSTTSLQIDVWIFTTEIKPASLAFYVKILACFPRCSIVQNSPTQIML